MLQGDGRFATRRFAAPDGLTLSARVYGEALGGSVPVVCLAGLTRNARDFHELALHLSERARNPRKVVAFDYRGRGESERDSDWRNYTVVKEADDVVAGCAALGVERAAFIGTSRGGLIVHILAATRPEMIAAAVLNDVGPAIEGAGLAQIRAYMEKPSSPATFADAAALIKAANGASFPALGDADWTRMAHALYRTEGGVPVLDYDPELVRLMQALDFSEALPTLWPQFEALKAVPVLAIRGEHSALLSAATLTEMARRHPSLEAVTVAGQGHAPLLETGDLPQRIAGFLEQLDPA